MLLTSLRNRKSTFIVMYSLYFVFSWSQATEYIQNTGTVLGWKQESCCTLEVDSTIWFITDLQEKKSISVHNGWNYNSDWWSTLLVTDLYLLNLFKNLCLESKSPERIMLVAEKLTRFPVQKHGKHKVYTYCGTW
jgi:hypothetical protein